jgi:hypothetical protein
MMEQVRVTLINNHQQISGRDYVIDPSGLQHWHAAEALPKSFISRFLLPSAQRARGLAG